MNERREENLKELFEKLLNAEDAERAAEDILEGEQILGSHTTPEPAEELITNIKAEIAGKLLHRKETTFREAVYKTMAIAAGFILISIISVKFFERDRSEGQKLVLSSVLPTSVWESECLADESDDLAILIAEVEQIENDLLALELGENGSDSYESLTELEMELIETNGDFWKG